MKDPVDHILRPHLPWRCDSGAITECGYDASKVKTLTREEYFARLKDMGQQRTALMTCMTCSNTAQRWGSWEDDPRLALHREIEWEGGWRHTGNKRGQRLKDELFAIAALIAAHREEFDAAIAATEQQREWLAKKDAMQAKRRHATREPTL